MLAYLAALQINKALGTLGWLPEDGASTYMFIFQVHPHALFVSQNGNIVGNKEVSRIACGYLKR